MSRIKALVAGSTVAGVTSAYTGGIGISGLGSAVGVGFIPIVMLGGLLALGGYELYKFGERRALRHKDIFEMYDRRQRQ